MDDTVSVTNLYPLHRCKTIHLVRHAQGFHNVAGEKEHSAYMSEEFFDAKLTDLGWQQVDNLRKHVHSSGIDQKVELVIVSPLLRTLQTAVGVFGGGYTNETEDLLMVENALDSNRAAISSLDCPPFLAVELCRERLGVHPCDRRRSINEYRPVFPGIDFSQIESDADIMWKPDIREKNEDVGIRGMQFLNWLWTRKEREIAVVTHSGLLINTMTAFANDCHPSMKIEISKPFKNCELRSLVMIDRSGIQ
ncbi:phosphoglycerate mutase-like protein 1 [Impatiens glandulifera]|uniref:phosphoglycerate mutase-like protein 1 n=1 Tax=Impatiens glandulifera TaxID=253017 RepID=UPI001FB16AF4|nr:phosphoglycerate mutase-like protein 1 [Impatiens glandulifera]